MSRILIPRSTYASSDSATCSGVPPRGSCRSTTATRAKSFSFDSKYLMTSPGSVFAAAATARMVVRS
jgi:hypothetical protein